MEFLRPVDLAREHGLSTQAVRNYERDGFLPPAGRTASGYRTYTAVHAAALRAHLALVRAYGYAEGGQIMRAVNAGELDAALTAVDRGHAQLLRDRGTLDAVGRAVEDLTSDAPRTAGPGTAAPGTAGPGTAGGGPLGIGELAHRLGVTPATLRNWERAGILAPVREPVTGHRSYGAQEVRDAELAHLLRRGGHPLAQIRTVVHQIRSAGGTGELSAALDDWRRRLTARGVAMLDAAARLAAYVALLDLAPAAPRRGT
ncbi:TioE family transcriptional regulator [Streptomyces caatingaensis]|uniref:MerR family transcriptional regulator n=1 Tax=Streptomyces caatingaensis TaxID=1678637 RepID=A0A0K9XCK6_9ACTN|nr:TioE family transcriptional regulator [Streptomyces caatingaensis]KNB50943.1 MerR family transcriptional regulator [Streptomyces caatingaensis]